MKSSKALPLAVTCNNDGNLTRRSAFRPMLAASAVAFIPAALLACSRAPNCNDVSALSPEELLTRNEIAKYTEPTLEAAKRCSGCVQYIAAAPKQCGGCKIVKGPISPDGGCALFVLKQT